MRIEKIGGNRKGATVTCLRHLCVSEEKMSVIYVSVKFFGTRLTSFGYIFFRVFLVLLN